MKKYSLYNLYLVFTFAAVGRVSEAMFASYNNAMWHCDGYLTFDWTELKVASIKTMNFFLDEKPCMASQSTSYREWKSNLKCIAEKVELRVIVDLFGQENYDKFHPKKKASKKYINSIYDAMSARRDSDGNIIPRTKKRKVQSDVSNL